MIPVHLHGLASNKGNYHRMISKYLFGNSLIPVKFKTISINPKKLPMKQNVQRAWSNDDVMAFDWPD
jgi:hypothetical protein